MDFHAPICKICALFISLIKNARPLSGKLTWSHYCELLSISDANKRSFYEKEAINAGWSVRELKRQISTSLYERLLLSEGKANKETVRALANKGNRAGTPADMIKDPYVFEFLGLPENKPLMASDLEAALVAQIEQFLLELGRGSCLLARSNASPSTTPITTSIWFSTTRSCAPMCSSN